MGNAIPVPGRRKHDYDSDEYRLMAAKLEEEYQRLAKLNASNAGIRDVDVDADGNNG